MNIHRKKLYQSTTLVKIIILCDIINYVFFRVNNICMYNIGYFKIYTEKYLILCKLTEMEYTLISTTENKISNHRQFGRQTFKFK